MPNDEDQLSPADVAFVDQADALLDELIRLTREHMARCPHNGAGYCIGATAVELIQHADCDLVATALGGAVVRLAKP